MLLPERINLSHRGNDPLTCTPLIAPPLLERHLNHTPFAGVTYTNAKGALGSADPKYTSPAFKPPLVLVKEVPCPFKMPPPLGLSKTRWKPPGFPSNPAPPPATVQSNP